MYKYLAKSPKNLVEFLAIENLKKVIYLRAFNFAFSLFWLYLTSEEKG